MPQFDGSPYTQLTTPARADVQGVIKDISETLPENQTKYVELQDLMKYGAWASKLLAVTATGSVTLLDTDPMFVEIDPNGSNRDVNFPAKGNDNHGYFVHHVGSANTLTLKRSGGATITTLTAGQIKYIKPSTANDFSVLTGGIASVVAGTGISVDNTDPANPIVSASGAGGGVGKNVLINGGMQVSARGDGPFTSATTFVNNDDTYLIDGAILLSDGNDIVDVSRVADNDFVSGWKIRLDVETANKRFGILLPVENADIQGIRKAGAASLQFKVKRTGTSMGNVRALLLAWNSTADAITSDVISAWGTAGNDPTLATNWTKENNGSNLAISTTIATKEIENIVVDTSGVTNLAVLIMVDDTDASIGDFLEIGDIKLETGASCTDYVNDSIEDVVSRCHRWAIPYFASSANALFAIGMCTASTQGDFILYFPVQMRSTPSMVQAGTFRIYQTGAINATISLSVATNKTAYITASVTGATSNAPALFQDRTDGSAKMLFTAEL